MKRLIIFSYIIMIVSCRSNCMVPTAGPRDTVPAGNASVEAIVWHKYQQGANLHCPHLEAYAPLEQPVRKNLAVSVMQYFGKILLPSANSPTFSTRLLMRPTQDVLEGVLADEIQTSLNEEDRIKREALSWKNIAKDIALASFITALGASTLSCQQQEMPVDNSAFQGGVALGCAVTAVCGWAIYKSSMHCPSLYNHRDSIKALHLITREMAILLKARPQFQNSARAQKAIDEMTAA